MSVTKYNVAKIAGGTRILTPWFRAAFASVFQPAKPMDPTKEGKYEITLLLDEKNVDITALKAAVYECAKAKFGGKIPASPTYDLPPWCNSPFHAGEEKPDYDGYEGMTYFRASSKFAPQVIDANRVEIGALDQPGLYSGCIARATVSPWAYDTSQRKGVSFNIHNLQKLAEGAAFGSARVDAGDEFDAADDFEGPAISQGSNDGYGGEQAEHDWLD